MEHARAHTQAPERKFSLFATGAPLFDSSCWTPLCTLPARGVGRLGENVRAYKVERFVGSGTRKTGRGNDNNATIAMYSLCLTSDFITQSASSGFACSTSHKP